MPPGADWFTLSVTEGPRPVLWVYFEAPRRGLLLADELARWAQDAPPPQRPVTLADRDAYRYL